MRVGLVFYAFSKQLYWLANAIMASNVLCRGPCVGKERVVCCFLGLGKDNVKNFFIGIRSFFYFNNVTNACLLCFEGFLF